MEPTNIIKCASCQAEIDTDRDGSYLTRSGEEICESCEQSAWEYPCQVITTLRGEVDKYLWCSEFGYRDTEYFEEAECEAVPEFKYVRTDGWRGYWDVQLGSGYTNLASGWSTGYWEDVPWKHKFNDLVDEVLGGKLECPYEIIFAFAPTSNVFSTSSDVICRESDVESITQWLCDEAGISIDELKQSLK